MARIRIRASSALALTAVEPPPLLRDRLRALCPTAPRRLNRFTELALIGALTCVQRSGMALPPDTPLYVATGHGYADDTARLLEGFLMQRQIPMPVDFINVSGGSAGFYLAQMLELRGPNNTVAAGSLSFEAALNLACGALLDQPGLALVGGVDVASYPLADHRRRLNLPPATAVAEISSWLLLDSRSAAGGNALVPPVHYGCFDALIAGLGDIAPVRCILGKGLTPDERSQLRALIGDAEQPTADAGHADTAAAYSMTAELEQPFTDEWVHINGDGTGSYYLIALCP